uniref:Uncharacterized protein n=1 Tax=Arundo donax TaxID=35708 RepID=A0A0A9H1U1_ARUDO
MLSAITCKMKRSIHYTVCQMFKMAFAMLHGMY